MTGKELAPLSSKVNAVAMTAAAKRKASNAIEHGYAEYIRKGGLKDATEEVQKQATKASTHLFELAQFSAKRLAAVEDAQSLFLGLCGYAEDKFKTEHQIDNLEDAFPSWKQFKTVLLRGWRMGLDVREFESLYDMRKSLMARVRAGAELEDGRVKRKKQGPIDLDEVQDWLGATGIHDDLRSLLAQVIFSVERVKRGKVKAVEALFKRTAQELRELTG